MLFASDATRAFRVAAFFFNQKNSLCKPANFRYPFSTMSPIAITLILLLVALVLFGSEKLPVDVVGILLVIGLVMTGVLNIQEGVAGFGNDIIITIAGLFVLVGGLIKTGLVDLIGRRLYRIAGNNEFLLTALIMTMAAVSASVLKNTTTTAMFLPVVIGLASKAKIAPSKLLMPLAFGRDFGRKLHADRNFDESSGQRRDHALRNGTAFDVRVDAGRRDYGARRADLYAFFRQKTFAAARRRRILYRPIRHPRIYFRAAVLPESNLSAKLWAKRISISNSTSTFWALFAATVALLRRVRRNVLNAAIC
jgi:hypothetical protein